MFYKVLFQYLWILVLVSVYANKIKKLLQPISYFVFNLRSGFSSWENSLGIQTLIPVKLCTFIFTSPAAILLPPIVTL